MLQKSFPFSRRTVSSTDRSQKDTAIGRSLVLPSELTPADLIAACVEDGGPAFWEEFVRRFRPVLLSAVSTVCRRCGLDPNEHRDDLLQEVFLKISDDRAQVLRRFVSSSENAAFAYLKVVAVHTCLDWMRARRAAKRGGSASEVNEPESFSSPARTHQESVQLERDILLRQIDGILQDRLDGQFASRDRSIFWLYYRVGMEAATIASIPHLRLGAKGVESVIGRLTRMLRTVLSEGAREGKDAPTALNKGRR